MSWTKPRKQDAVEAILHKGSPCLTSEDTWNAFQDTFNAAHSRDAYPGRLGPALNPKPKWDWIPFSGKEIAEALTGCSGQSAPGPDHLTWSHIKLLVIDESILKLLVWLVNASFMTGIWPDYFKTSKTVVIPKPNKPV